MPNQPAQQKIKGGRKLRRCAKHKTMYAAQFRRTARNKINRLLRRFDFDPTAESSAQRIQAVAFKN